PDARGGRRVMRRMEEVQRYTKLGETAFMEEKRELAWAFIRTHWGLETRLTWRRVLNFWGGTDAPRRNFRETHESLVGFGVLANFVTGCGALLGLLALWGKERAEKRRKERAEKTKGERITQRRRDARGNAEEEEHKEREKDRDGEKREELSKQGMVFPLAVY